MIILHADSARSWRGGQNQVLLTAEGQAARGHQVALACRRGGALAARARGAGLQVHAAGFRGEAWPTAVLALARLVRRLSPEVVHLHDPHAISTGVLALRLARRRPLTIATRRVDFELGRLSRWKYLACHRVIVVSRAIARVIEAGGVPPERLRLVYEGVPDRTPPAGGREALNELGVPPSAAVVGNVAALTDHKDHATLVAAATLLMRQAPHAYVVVVGEGEERSALEARIRDSGLAGRVILTGFRGDVDRLLAAFDVFCLSSRLEGLGTSVLDAMAFALPVVATDAGGLPEAVEDGVTGRVVPGRDPRALADALWALLADPERRLSMGAAGRRRFLERFTAARMVEGTLAAYEDLACGSG
jgi:glycosyltransferase involved in cell wall biosynthesis